MTVDSFFTSMRNSSVVLTINLDTACAGPLDALFVLEHYYQLAVQSELSGVMLLNTLHARERLFAAIVICLREGMQDGPLLADWLHSHCSPAPLQRFPRAIAFSWAPHEFDAQRLRVQAILNIHRLIPNIRRELHKIV